MIRHEDMLRLPSGIEIRCCSDESCATFVEPIAIPVDVGEGYEIGLCYARQSNGERIGPRFLAVAEALAWITAEIAKMDKKDPP